MTRAQGNVQVYSEALEGFILMKATGGTSKTNYSEWISYNKFLKYNNSHLIYFFTLNRRFK